MDDLTKGATQMTFEPLLAAGWTYYIVMIVLVIALLIFLKIYRSRQS